MYGLRGLGDVVSTGAVLSTPGTLPAQAPAITVPNAYIAGLLRWVTSPSGIMQNAQDLFGGEVAKVYGSSMAGVEIAGFLTPLAIVAYLLMGRGGSSPRRYGR